MVKTHIYSPLDGEVIQIENVSDPVFSQKMLGDGIAIRPALGHHSVLSPIDGTIQSLHSSKHAYGILSNTGVEVLVHIGVDTVNLKGEGFSSNLVEGSIVKKGQELAKVDFALISQKAPSIDVIIVLTSLLGTEKLDKTTSLKIKSLDELISIE